MKRIIYLIALCWSAVSVGMAQSEYQQAVDNALVTLDKSGITSGNNIGQRT